MKVRATQDGIYAGYFRYGPIEGDNGVTPGDIFEIDDTPFQVKDMDGKPAHELDAEGKPIPILVNGKPKFEDGKQQFKIKMGTWFSPEWMERVPDDTEVTTEYKPFEIPDVYKVKKMKTAQNGNVKAIPLPPAVAALVNPTPANSDVI